MTTPAQAARDVLQAHIAALNAGDAAALADTLHFPHFRLSGAALKTWTDPACYLADFHARAGSEWARSQFKDMRVVQASDDKVHLDVAVHRYNADGQEISTFRSLWVITCEQGRWAAKFRSSFAAQ